MGVEIAIGTVLYQAKAASADSAEPIYQPAYILGSPAYAEGRPRGSPYQRRKSA